MQLKRDLNFAANLDVDEVKQRSKKEASSKQSQKERAENINSANDSSDSFDASFFQELMKEDDKFMEMLIKTNDKAASNIAAGNMKDALYLLEKMERILEFAASSGKVLDRNLVIVCLYNIACAQQGLWVLDKCSRYIDAVIYNLNHSLKQDEISLSNQQNRTQIQYIKAIKLKKQQFLLKVYLQHCAVLSQLSQ